MITARVGEFGDKTLGAEFGEVVAKGSERVAFAGAAKRFEDGGVEFGRGEGINQSITNPTFTRRIEEKASERRSGFSLEFFASCAWTKRPCF